MTWTRDPLRADLHAQAEVLNRRLYDDNPDIDWNLVELLRPQIDAVSHEMGYDDEYRENWQRHRFRLAASIVGLRKLLREGDTALELGGTDVASILLRAHFPGVEWNISSWDLRSAWPCESESYDAVVSMEVLEHLSDLPCGFNEHLDFSGLKTCLDECHRILRRGGRMFVTTPNAASIVCLRQILFGSTAVFYSPHIREYARDNLEAAVRSAGFIIESMRAVHCLSLATHLDHTSIFEVLLAFGLPTADRGDDWFIVARKG